MKNPGCKPGFSVIPFLLNILVICVFPTSMQHFFIDPGFDVNEKVSNFVPEKIDGRDGGGNCDKPANSVD